MTRTKKGGVVSVGPDGEALAAARGNDNTTPTGPGSRKKGKKKTPKSPLKFLDADTDSPCKICRKVVDSGPKSEAVECDRCSAWVHFNCSKLGREEYEYLTNHPHTQMLWFCKTCRAEMKETRDVKGDRLAQQGAKIDSFTEVINSIQKQMSDLKGEMTKVVKNTTDNGWTEVTSNGGTSRGPTQMQIQVSEALEDQKEKEEKRNNIILFNVPETIKSDEKTEFSQDLETIKEIISVVHPNADTVALSGKNVMRLGGRRDGKVRPIKIQFQEDFTKGKVFRNSAKLRNSEKYGKVNISGDKTKKELEADRLLREKLMAARLEKPDDDLIIYRGNIIPRRERPARA